MKHKWLKQFIATLLFLFSLTACSSRTFPMGMYIAKESGAQMEFMEDGSFIYADEGVVWASGTYSIDGNELIWETDSSCDESGIERSTYTWSYENGLLVLEEKGEDLCEGRVRSVNQLEWEYRE